MQPILRSAITSTVSLLVIALTNPLLTANADEAGTEFYWREAKEITTFTELAGNETPRENLDIRLMVKVDEQNGNAKFREPVDGDDWGPWGHWRPALFDRTGSQRWEAVQLTQQILHTKTEFTMFRNNGKFYVMRTQSRVSPKFETEGIGACRPY